LSQGTLSLPQEEEEEEEEQPPPPPPPLSMANEKHKFYWLR
jgi:hypothetical protein